jgi:hypothetical protein
MVTSNLGVQNVSFSGNFAASRPTETTRRSNRCRQWGSSLAQKGLVAFGAKLVTLWSWIASVVRLGQVENGPFQTFPQAMAKESCFSTN